MFKKNRPDDCKAQQHIDSLIIHNNIDWESEYLV